MTEHYPNPHDTYTGGHLLDDTETNKEIQESKGELGAALGTLAENIANITIPENTQFSLDELANLFNWPAEQKHILPFVLSLIFSKDNNPFGKSQEEELYYSIREIKQRLKPRNLIFRHHQENATFNEDGKDLTTSKEPKYYFQQISK